MQIAINAKIRIVNSLAKEIQKQFSLKDVLTICNTPDDLFKDFANSGKTRIISEGLRDSYSGFTGETIVGDSFEILDNLKKTVDFIVGDLPLGMVNQTWINEAEKISIKAKKNWLIILKSLLKLNENGFGLFLIEPVSGSKKWDDFLQFSYCIQMKSLPPSLFQPK